MEQGVVDGGAAFRIDAVADWVERCIRGVVGGCGDVVRGDGGGGGGVGDRGGGVAGGGGNWRCF